MNAINISGKLTLVNIRGNHETSSHGVTKDVRIREEGKYANMGEGKSKL